MSDLALRGQTAYSLAVMQVSRIRKRPVSGGTWSNGFVKYVEWSALNVASRATGSENGRQWCAVLQAGLLT